MTIRGARHTPTCLCGCHFVVGLSGEITETYPGADLAIATFRVESMTGGAGREVQVAYSMAESKDLHRPLDTA